MKIVSLDSQNYCAKFLVLRPPEPLWTSRLREAATMVHANVESVVDKVV